MQIKFKQAHRISEDGFSTRVCKADEILDIAETAACHAIRKGWATRVPTNPSTYQSKGSPL